MSTSVVMPRLSDSMEEGTVVRWLKQVGDVLQVGDELVEIETDKATVVHEAETAGTMLEIMVAAGETVSLGVQLARIGEPGDAAAWASAATEGASALPDRVAASPVARRIARELGVDLGSVVGTGPSGRIVKSDVEASAPAPPSVEPPGITSVRGETEMLEPTRVQQTVARRMAEAKSTIPDFTLFCEVDMSACVELRGRLKGMTDRPPSYNDLVVKAAALALREHPKANAAFRDGHYELYGRINVGVAVAREDGLVVPTILDADQKSLGQIARESERLAAAVRDGSVTPAELAGGTFTVSNLGMYGVSAFQAIINPGQAAILSVGAMTRRAVVTPRGAIVAIDGLTLGLVCDHRILDGAQGARFLGSIRDLLERPAAMAL
jgi:pyruvate dehydrogenase E2 component (dihydrolipoamide acetyltransferase)